MKNPIHQVAVPNLTVIARGVRLLAVAACLTSYDAEILAEETRPTATDGAVQTAGFWPQSPPGSTQVDRWIDQLHHDSFTVRQAAAKQLLSAGITAREPLAELVNGPDPETRAAARRLVTLIDQSEFSRRLEAFAADSEDQLKPTLPGWEQFRDLIGGGPAARALFVEMQRREASLLAGQFERATNSAAPPWEARLQRLSQWRPSPDGRRNAPPLGSCAAMFFLSTVIEGGTSAPAAMSLANLVRRPPLGQAVRGPARNEAVRQLITAWAVRCPNRTEAVLQQRLSVAQELELREAVPLALDVASGPAFLTAQPALRGNALLLAAQLGSRGDAEALEPLLEDATVCLTLGAIQAGQLGQPGAGPMDLKVRDVQIRDVALAAMLRLTDQDPIDYGYQPNRPANEQLDLSALSLSDEQRTRAVEKWRAWAAKQADTLSGPVPADE